MCHSPVSAHAGLAMLIDAHNLDGVGVVKSTAASLTAHAPFMSELFAGSSRSMTTHSKTLLHHSDALLSSWIFMYVWPRRRLRHAWSPASCGLRCNSDAIVLDVITGRGT